MDAILQKFRNTDECGALTTMVDRSDIPKALVLADRNYESYNNLAHIQQKNWAFLFRIKDGKTGIGAGLALPDSDEFDVPIHLKITNRMTNDVKKLLQIGNCCKYIPRRNRFDFLPKNAIGLILSSFTNLALELSASKYRMIHSKRLSRTWSSNLSLFLNSNSFMPCAGELKPLSVI